MSHVATICRIAVCPASQQPAGLRCNVRRLLYFCCKSTENIGAFLEITNFLLCFNIRSRGILTIRHPAMRHAAEAAQSAPESI